MTTKSYEAEQLINGISRNYPVWPSTFSTCECKRSWARGAGKCAECLEEDLAGIIGKPLAWEIHQTIKQFSALKREALDIAGE